MRRFAIAWLLAALVPLLGTPPRALAGPDGPEPGGIAAALPVAELSERAEGIGPDGSVAPSEEEARAARRERVRTCRTLVKQIAHFEQVADRARERDNELWERATEAQIERLSRRAAAECPKPDDRGFDAFVQALGNAARTAARLATLGAF